MIEKIKNKEIQRPEDFAGNVTMVSERHIDKMFASKINEIIDTINNQEKHIVGLHGRIRNLELDSHTHEDLSVPYKVNIRIAK